MAKSIIILYGNKDHSEVPTQTYLDMSKPEEDMDKMFGAIERAKVPIVWSTQGIDLDALKVRNYSLANRIASNPNIGLTVGLYTHSLPSFYPEHLDDQLCRGYDAARTFGGFSRVGMMPEFDVYEGAISLMNSAGWDSVLLQTGVNHHYDWREGMAGKAVCSDSGLVRLRDQLGNSITGIVTEGPELRALYLKMLRGFVKPGEMVDGIARKADERERAGCPVMPFLMDFEAVQINKTQRNDSLGRFEDYIGELARADSSGKLELGIFDNQVENAIDNYDAPAVQLAARPKPKWLFESGYKYADRLKSFDFDVPEYQRKAYHWACISDVFSAHFDMTKPQGIVARLPVQLDSGKFDDEVIIRGAEERIAEVEHVIEAIKSGRPVYENMNGLSEASQHRMCYLDRIFLLGA